MAAEQKRSRISRYRPKEEDMNYRLQCEWHTCEEMLTNMDTFLDHIDQHINEYLFSKELFVTQQHQPQFDQPMLNLECKWRECDIDTHKFDSISTYERHVRYHAFHTKLKFIGFTVIDELNKKSQNTVNQIHVCTLDQQSRNLIPELPFKFECSWMSCEFNTDNPELFYRHVKEHIEEYREANKTAKKNKTDIGTFYRPKQIRYFLNIFTDLQGSYRKCQWSECDQEIKNINRLTEHLRHHSQEKQVACYICGALFATFTKFLDHCSRTNTQAQTQTTITNNNATITTLINANLNSIENQNLIQFQCSHCNKKFLTNNLLKEHIRKHINKYKCDQV